MKTVRGLENGQGGALYDTAMIICKGSGYRYIVELDVIQWSFYCQLSIVLKKDACRRYTH